MTDPLILVVDDDLFFAELAKNALGDGYRVEFAHDGSTGLARAEALKPDVILLDVEMPAMDGYAVCRTLKAQETLQGIPVVFVSARMEAEDRLAGYDAGGDDYVTKPYKPLELRAKIDQLLRIRVENARLASEASDARNLAMTALTTAGETGIIMRFLTAGLSCDDYGALAQAILQACEEFGVDASIQLRDKTSHFSRNRDGLSPPLEASVLSNLALVNRFAELGSRMGINYDHVTLLLKSLPTGDDPRRGRLRDNLTIIAEAANTRMRSLITQLEVVQRGDEIMRLVQHLIGALREIETASRQNKVVGSEILHGLVEKIESSFVHLGLLENQESYLQELIRDAVQAAVDLYDGDDKIGSLVHELMEQANGILGQELRDSIKAGGATNRIEVW